jgi:hypothetical protein
MIKHNIQLLKKNLSRKLNKLQGKSIKGLFGDEKLYIKHILNRVTLHNLILIDS